MMIDKHKHNENKQPRQPRLGETLRRVIGPDGQRHLALQVCATVAKGAS